MQILTRRFAKECCLPTIANTNLVRDVPPSEAFDLMQLIEWLGFGNLRCAVQGEDENTSEDASGPARSRQRTAAKCRLKSAFYIDTEKRRQISPLKEPLYGMGKEGQLASAPCSSLLLLPIVNY